jgi:hypothetical protein
MHKASWQVPLVHFFRLQESAQCWSKWICELSQFSVQKSHTWSHRSSVLGDKTILWIHLVIEDFILWKKRHVFLFLFLFYATWWYNLPWSIILLRAHLKSLYLSKIQHKLPHTNFHSNKISEPTFTLEQNLGTITLSHNNFYVQLVLTINGRASSQDHQEHATTSTRQHLRNNQLDAPEFGMEPHPFPFPLSPVYLQSLKKTNYFRWCRLHLFYVG